MRKVKKIFSNIDFKDFKKYLFLSILVIVTLAVLGSVKLTQARYENETMVRVKPTLAFFIVDVQSQSGQIKIDGMVPRSEPYLYSFTVSNFKNSLHANVDLVYTIEIITTTNMPLNFRIFKGNMQSNEVDVDTITTNDDGVYFRHLVINDITTMSYRNNITETYTLWVEFPETYKVNADDYAGIIDLVDIKINAEQVV